MTDLIEAIARGICVANGCNDPDKLTYITDDGIQQPFGPAWAWHEPEARAALLAIEQSGTHVVASIMPTPDMVETGMEAMVKDLGNPVSAPPSYIVWRAMLSARPKMTT